VIPAIAPDCAEKRASAWQNSAQSAQPLPVSHATKKARAVSIALVAQHPLVKSVGIMSP
jgi:hypothetical protein